VTSFNFTVEELESLWIKIHSKLLASTLSPEEIKFIAYLQLIKTVEPKSWGINEVFNEESIKEPEDVSVLTDPLENMPLKINDPNKVIQTIAVWRLEIAK